MTELVYPRSLRVQHPDVVMTHLKDTRQKLTHFVAKAMWESGKADLIFVNCFFHARYVESDLIVITRSGYCHEFEIKTALDDLRKEYSKDRWRAPSQVKWYAGGGDMARQYWIVVPHQLSPRAAGIARPDHGLMRAGRTRFESAGRTDEYWHLQCERRAKVRRSAPKVPEKIIEQNLRRASFARWRALGKD